MHRSGTSCLAGCLEEAGLDLGVVNRAAPFNRKGNNENQRVMRLHDDLLAANGGSWDAPPSTVSWADSHLRRRDEILTEYRGLRVFGIKDPRTLFTLEGWRAVLPNLEVVGTFRHPRAVAESLRSRNGFTLDRGLALWEKYNRRLLSYQAEFGADLVSFDLESADYLRRIGQIALRLELSPPVDGFSFFAPELRSHSPDELQPLPPSVRETYGRLRELEL